MFSVACNTSRRRVRLGMELHRYSKPGDSCAMHPQFIFEIYVSTVNGYVSVVGRARFGDAVRALSSPPDQLLQSSKTNVGGSMWSTSLWLPDEFWRTALSNHNLTTREVSS